MGSATDSRVEKSIARAAEALFASQRSSGSWPNRRPTSVMGTAGALTALHLADRERSQDLVDGGVQWLLGAQNADGGWGGSVGTATQVVPTVIAATALRMAAPHRTGESVRRAMDLVASHGGVEALPDPGMTHVTSAFLALAELRDMRDLRRVPLEVFLLPPWLWRRRLSFSVPLLVALAFIQRPHSRPRGLLGMLARPAGRAGLRALQQVEIAETRRGGYGGDNWLASAVCVGLSRAEEAPRRATLDVVDYLRSNVHADGSWHLIQGLDLIGSAYVTRGLAEAGYADDPRLVRARTWLRGCQQDEASPVFDAPAGGWSWEGPRGWPNFLDTAVVLSALTAGGVEEPDEQLRHGLRWLESRQDRKGSWGTFIPDTAFPNDGPCPYATAQCVDVLAENGTRRDDPRIRRAVNWLLARQRTDGTYEALWYRGLTPGTAMALVAFSRVGLADHPVARRARDALVRAQLGDGSWGPGRKGRLGDDPSTGTVEETAWALRALLASGMPADDPRARRAADWIASAQQPDGLWRPSPVHMYIRDLTYYVDGLIVQGLALKALGRYRAALAGEPSEGREVS
ncbi:hypothetical protein LRS74_01270 [Streptomyces sp. LX-29]|uniref:prenyltransferase/squalene oxidase repeat-containing protein n=1 Tax=Streptomyces sp. LX-29 TaxID=2900152 RepID=UPI00240E9785|nr:prenyltransferase/squalene oxidase repeat-containing protein [Streptomyces sp. LX-29]WFB05800.1 hypothetical protein LRS74_01270 [Streptomyces sp. LX-29]